MITTTHLVENWPGEKSITGWDLGKKLEEHAANVGVDMKDENVEKVEKTPNGFKVKTNRGEYEASALILATGTEHRQLPAKGNREFYGKGVSYCAACDGPFFKDKVVAMVGAGDSACKESLLLAEHAKKVYIIVRGDDIHPEPINYDRVMAKVKEGKIEIIKNTNVVEVKGEKFVSSVKLDKPFNGKDEIELQGVFVAIGLLPQTDLAKQLGVELTEHGEIKIDRYSHTNVPGVFAAGDVVDNSFKQGITGAAEGVHAAHSAFEYIGKLKK